MFRMAASLSIVAPASPALAALGECGQPVSMSAAGPTATDALGILLSSVTPNTPCPPPAPGAFHRCVCDVNDSGTVTATDALTVLRAAVGLPAALDCHCTGVTSTTSSTTSTTVPPGVCGGDACAFITDEVYDGDFGGIANADNACNQIAMRNGLPGFYRAWLSENEPRADAIDRLTEFGPWRRVDGKLVAVDRADLTDGTLANPIQISAEGLNLGQRLVRTGTQADGTVTPETAQTFTCHDWLSASTDTVTVRSTIGRADRTDEGWTALPATHSDCTGGMSLLCFEVGDTYCTAGGVRSNSACFPDVGCQPQICLELFGNETCIITGTQCASASDCEPVTCE
jgi:hypothetical protein